MFLFMSSIQYLGIIIGCNGRRPDLDKVRAIRDMPRPTNVSTLQSFLGMINYYNQFIPDMHKLRTPFNHLLSKIVRWHWSAECEESFTKVRDILMSGLSLTHYDPKQDIIVAAEASEYGIGAVLSHRFPDSSTKAVSHMSRSLTPTEKKYSQIEKEGLALVFAVRKFHKMIHGRKFLLQTDHKPLVATFGAKKGRRGAVLYEVSVDDSFCVRHVNQLKHRRGNNQMTSPAHPSKFYVKPSEFQALTLLQKQQSPWSQETQDQSDTDGQFDLSTFFQKKGHMYTA